MAYDANPDATSNPTAGAVAPTSWGDLVNANFVAIGAAWTAFTPTWTADTTNPAIGNGTITGAYLQLGKTLDFRVRILMGSTTTYGTGAWRITLPNSLTSVATPQVVGAALGFDTGVTYYLGVGFIDASTTLVRFVRNDASQWGSNQPFAWGNTDILELSGRLEVA